MLSRVLNKKGNCFGTLSLGKDFSVISLWDKIGREGEWLGVYLSFELFKKFWTDSTPSVPSNDIE